jgi:hypothetical protein
MSILRKLAVVLVLAVLGGCAAAPSSSLHKSLVDQPDQQMPHKMLLLPADIRVHEISAGGVVEKVDDWTSAASNHAMKSMRGIADSKKLFELKETPSLSEADRQALEQHQALYELVANSADFARSGPLMPWRERAKNFDYTIGPGLKELAAGTGMDAAVIVIGSDYISSAGRKATMAIGILAAAFTGVAIVPAGGVSYVSVGVVELRTGNLLWFATNRGQSSDLREENQMQTVLSGLFESYPGATPAKNTTDAGK